MGMSCRFYLPRPRCGYTVRQAAPDAEGPRKGVSRFNPAPQRLPLSVREVHEHVGTEATENSRHKMVGQARSLR